MKGETKKAKTKRCQDLIDSQRMGALFGPEALAEFMGLTGEDLLAAKRAKNPRYPNDPRHVRVQWPDGEWSEMSWTKRRDAIAGLLRFCAKCQSEDDLTTDHTRVPFDAIAEEWLARNAPVEIEKCPDGIGYRITRRDQAAAWITEHAGKSTYQILCRSCNASKGARIS